METNANSTRWTVRVGSLAIACVLLGATAALATPCYACTSYCTQVGVENGFLSQAADGSLTKIGGTGWAACGPGGAPGSAKALCFKSVQDKCAELCAACQAMQTGPPINDCGSDRCRTITGVSSDGLSSSVCNDICACGTTGKFCQNLQVVAGGLVSTENVRCGCPPN